MKNLLIIAFILPLLLWSCDNENDDGPDDFDKEVLYPFMNQYYDCVNPDDSADCIKSLWIGAVYDIGVYFVDESNSFGTRYEYDSEKLTFRSNLLNKDFVIYYKIQNGEITFYNGDYIYKKREE